MTTQPTKKPSRLQRELADSADYLHSIGGLDDATHAKITVRVQNQIPAAAPQLSPDEIRALRKRANMSQAVFAGHLNVTKGYVSQLERGTKRPDGPALVLLHVIRRQGIQALAQSCSRP